VRPRRAARLGVLVAALAGCSGEPAAGDGAFPAEPLSTTKSQGGALSVAVRTSPSQPPPRGTCAVELTVTDAAGTPVDGLAVVVVPFMPSHGHGASVKPTVTARGGGRYEVANVTLFMPGSWELRTTFSGKVEDRAAPIVNVP
jgi:hypothetical protein